MILQRPAEGQLSDVNWMSPERGLWVASRRGEHAGMVERLDGLYHARNARGRELGSFDDLDSARRSIDGHAYDPPGASRQLITRLLWAVNAIAVIVALALGIALVR